MRIYTFEILIKLNEFYTEGYTFEILIKLNEFYTEGYRAIFGNWKKKLYILFFITVRPCVSFEFMESVTFSWGIFLGRFSVVTTIKTASKYKLLLLQCTGGSSAFTRGVGTGTFQWEWNFTDAKPVSRKTYFLKGVLAWYSMPYILSTLCFLAALYPPTLTVICLVTQSSPTKVEAAWPSG